MKTVEFVGIDTPHALHGAAELAERLARDHRHVPEHIDMLAINPGARSGMRAIYSVKLEALVKALNELAHCQREIEARVMDAMEAAYGSEAECAVLFLTMPSSGGAPESDEQS